MTPGSKGEGNGQLGHTGTGGKEEGALANLGTKSLGKEGERIA